MTSTRYPATTAHEHLCLLHLLLLILKSDEEASAMMERARDRGDHKKVNFPSSSIPKILYFLAGFGLSQFIGVFIYYVIFR